MGFVMLAYYKGNAIAGGVFLHYNKKLIYKYGAADPAYMNLYGTHALLWEAIQWGCNNSYEVMDWGKTEKSNQGLRNFKLGWGTEEKELIYSYIGSPKKEYSSGLKESRCSRFLRARGGRVIRGALGRGEDGAHWEPGAPRGRGGTEQRLRRILHALRVRGPGVLDLGGSQSRRDGAHLGGPRGCDHTCGHGLDG